METASRPRVPTWLVALLVAGAAALFQIVTVDHYAMTIDSPPLLYAGERTLFWLGHRDAPHALDFGGAEPPGFTGHFPGGRYSHDGEHYPVLPAFVGSVASRVLHDWWGVLDPIAGHHVGLVLLNAFGLFLFCLYGCALLGRPAGLAASIALALFPSALAHVPNNPKDWPCAQYYGLAILATALGVLRSRARHVLVGGAMLGISFASKMNAAFVLPTLALWAVPTFFLVHFRKKPLTPQVASAFTAIPYVAFGVFFVTWPFLWQGRLADWWQRLFAYGAHVLSYGVGQRVTWTDYPLRALVFMTPPVVLLAAVTALVGWRRRGEELSVWLLLVLWTGLPLLRIAAPRSNFYDANRHFLEYIPGLCALAGVGGVEFARFASRALKGRLPERARRALVPGLVAVGLVGVIWPVAEYHPYEVAYFNSLIGGLGGAQRRALFAMSHPQDARTNGTEGDYWNSSVRDALTDLRRLAGPNMPISACGCPSGHPSAFVVNANDVGTPPLKLIDCSSPEYRTSKLLLASPREFGCSWREIREHEGERPVLKRVERGGGLIYEILGERPGPGVYPSTLPETASRYEREPHANDRVAQRLAEARKVANGRSISKRETPQGVVYDVLEASGAVVHTQAEPR